MTTTTRLQESAKEHLGPHWARRLNAALDTLIESEAVIYGIDFRAQRGLGDVCEALRTILDDKRS